MVQFRGQVTSALIFWRSCGFQFFSAQPQTLHQWALKQNYSHHTLKPKMRTLNQTDLSSHFCVEIWLPIDLLLTLYLTCKMLWRPNSVKMYRTQAKFRAVNYLLPPLQRTGRWFCLRYFLRPFLVGFGCFQFSYKSKKSTSLNLVKHAWKYI